MRKRTLKVISSFAAFIFTFSILVPPSSFAELPCWNDGSIASGSGGTTGLTAAKPPDNTNNAPYNGEPVNLATGAYTYTHQDIFIPCRGLLVEISRTYNSLDDYEGPFGIGWSHNYNVFLIEISEGEQTYILRRNSDSSKDKFLKVSDDSYEPVSEGCYDRLIRYEVIPVSLQQVTPEDLVSGYFIQDKHSMGYLFDLSGKLRVVFDRNYNKITFEYDNLGRLISIVDAVQRKTILVYNELNKISSITDFSGRVITYQYNATADLISVTTPGTTSYPEGLTTCYSYDNQHRLISITDPKANTYLTNTYDGTHRVVEQTYGRDKFYFSYNPNLTTFIDRKWFRTDYYLNPNGTTAKKVQYTAKIRPNEPSSYTTTYEYNEDKEVTKTTYPKGNSVIYEYDDKGNVLKIIRKPPLGLTVPDIITTFTYEPRYNFVKTITSPQGNTTAYYYDYEEETLGDLNGDEVTDKNNGNLVKVTSPAANGLTPQTLFTYNQYGQVETVIDPKAVVTKYKYEPNSGYLTKIINDYGDETHINAGTQFSYDAIGNIITTTDARNNTAKFEYNALNQLTKTISPSPSNYQTRYTYDENGNLIKLQRQADTTGTEWQTTEYEYGVLDELMTTKQYLGDTEVLITQFQYDGNENRTKVIDAEGNETNYVYDERDLLYNVTDALGNTTEYTYDANGNLISIKDARGNITSYAYDDFGRLLKTAYHDTSWELYIYDADSNLVSKQTRKGDTISYTYDSLNRLIQKTYPDSSDVDYEYDIASRLTQVTDSNGIIAYDYDNLNRVVSVTNDFVGIGLAPVRYEYDNVGNRTKLDYPDSTHISYFYDEMNRLKRIEDDSHAVLASYQYDPLSRRTQVDYANNTQATYTCDNVNRLVNLANKINGGADISTFGYTYDKVGNRLTKDETRGTTNIGMHNYGYDKIYQLTNVDYPDGYGFEDSSFVYDSLGNRQTVTEGVTTETYASNNLNQYTDIDNGQGQALPLQYDLNGNLLTDGRNSYEYDYENRLVSVTNSTTTATYSYDPFGRKISKSVTINQQLTTNNYLYDGDQIIAEYDDSGTLLRKYIYGTGIDEPIALVTRDQSTEASYYYHFDGLGSVTDIIDSSGAVIEKYSYDVYGRTVIKDAIGSVINESGIGNRFGFTGRELDVETGLYYYRARYYSPELGRFLQVDPMGYYAGISVYSYCFNNPVNFVDPLGLLRCDVDLKIDVYNEKDKVVIEGTSNVKGRTDEKLEIYPNPDNKKQRVIIREDTDFTIFATGTGIYGKENKVFSGYDVDLDFTFNQGAVYNLPGPFNPEISKALINFQDSAQQLSLEDITISNIQNFPGWLFEKNIMSWGERVALRKLKRQQEEGNKCPQK